jgi:16S rRNA (adenine1518-N6/adenine1519-N6)-dimethyltransferase
MSLETKTREIVHHFGFKFSKSLGQNFLINQEVLDSIVDAVEIDNETSVIEIGPGIGTLTQELARKAEKVVSIELDEGLIPVLSETLSNYKNIKVLHEDALKVDFKQLIQDEGLKKVKVAANLPYYVTTPIITKLFEDKPGIDSITVMIQKEVADRIAAGPGTKDYGALSLLVQYYSEVAAICVAPKECFIPEPKVESEVIRMNIRQMPAVSVRDEKFFFAVIRAAFNMRRKTLWNALKPLGLSTENLKKAFEDSGIDPQRRGETLSMEEFGRLADIIYLLKD